MSFLQQCYDPKATWVTPNNRLSHQIIDDLYHLHPLQRIQEKPRCLPYAEFLRQCYHEAINASPQSTHPILLNTHQQQHLWREIINKDVQTEAPRSLVQEIETAWTRCMLWNIPILSPDFAINQPTKQFQSWVKRFLVRLKALGAITTEQIIPFLIEHQPKLNHHNIIWICFDDFTPQQRQLQSLLLSQSIQQQTIDRPENQTPMEQYQAQDENDEKEAMFAWLKQQLTEQKQKIAIVVPDLKAQSHTFMRRLKQHLSEELVNLSLGQTLNQHPLIQHALNWLSLDVKNLNQEQRLLLLQSPYLIGSKAELFTRADVAQNPMLMDKPWESLFKTTPMLLNALKKLPHYPEKDSILGWIGHFRTRLSALGFPGEYPLDSIKHQWLQSLNALFDALMSCALITPQCTLQKALTLLKNLAQDIIFQPQKGHTPIHVLGLLEASGCSFDSIWICGLTQQTLPQKTAPSAFIPIHLQRSHNMPRALPQKELELAQKTLLRLKNGSSRLICSHPKLMGDIAQLPSPLLQDTIMYTPIIITPTPWSSLVRQEPLEPYIPQQNHETITGGTSILSHQAQCPFKAFAAHRLKAPKNPTQSLGLNALQRGQLVHRILEQLWRELKNQKNLLDLDALALEVLLNQTIRAVIQEFAEKHPSSFPSLTQTIEHLRQKKMIQASLDFEKQRAPFSIAALETSHQLSLAGMTFNIRIDRLDELADKSKWIIDYKSKLPAEKPWYEDRPEHPQLLIYALLDEHINTLLFMAFKDGSIQHRGISEQPLNFKGMDQETQWPHLKNQWEQQLTLLALEFKQGYCIPQPLKKTTCNHCDFPSLCRITTPDKQLAPSPNKEMAHNLQPD